MTKKPHVPIITTQRAKSLRRNETFTEKKLWEILKNRGYENLKFRRQFPIHPYIADFYCHDLRLVIELDGITHETAEKKAYDARRNAMMKKAGFRIIRISDTDFIEKPSLLFDAIDEIIEDVNGSGKN